MKSSGPRRDFEPEVRRSATLLAIRHFPIHTVLPREHPPPQHSRIDAERVANRIEAECVLVGRAKHYPSLGVRIEHPLPGAAGDDALLIDIYRVSQQRQHQALLPGQAMPPGDIEVLAGKNLIEADESLDGQIGTQLKSFRHLARPRGKPVQEATAASGPHRPR
ncbi:MAG: hypothetical protein JWM69_852 [Candidatus Binatus sp.]|nr:hypothetical protein [Candidatus Binatus sp.]